MEKIFQVAEIAIEYLPAKAWNKFPEIRTAKDAFDVLKLFYTPQTLQIQEQFIVLYLNQANAIIGAYKASLGGITGTVADIRLILGVALKMAATGIIISHNHPSGKLNPSSQDKILTSKLRNAGKLMDIKLLDHIIIGHNDTFSSLAEDGLI